MEDHQRAREVAEEKLASTRRKLHQAIETIESINHQLQKEKQRRRTAEKELQLAKKIKESIVPSDAFQLTMQSAEVKALREEIDILKHNLTVATRQRSEAEKYVRELEKKVRTAK